MFFGGALTWAGMLQVKSLLISATARLILQLAVVVLRGMQWLYGRHLIDQATTEHFFRAAKRLERWADRISAGNKAGRR